MKIQITKTKNKNLKCQVPKTQIFFKYTYFI